MRRTNFKKYKYAKAVCDRSGFTYPLREMVIEEGTGLLVHISESDGKYNRVTHPQNFPPKDIDEQIGLDIARPARDETAPEVAVSAPDLDVLWPYDRIIGGFSSGFSSGFEGNDIA